MDDLKFDVRPWSNSLEFIGRLDCIQKSRMDGSLDQNSAKGDSCAIRAEEIAFANKMN
jgi:hypothetical protein